MMTSITSEWSQYCCVRFVIACKYYIKGEGGNIPTLTSAGQG